MIALARWAIVSGGIIIAAATGTLLIVEKLANFFLWRALA